MAQSYPQYPEGKQPSGAYGDLEVEGALPFDAHAYGGNSVKNAFIKKVYAILSLQLIVTTLGAAFFMFCTPVRAWVLGSGISLLYVALFLPFGFIMALHCYKDRHPLNMFLLAGFTLCETYMVGVICALYYQQGAGMIVLQALVMTAAVFISLTSYVLITKKDFSWMGAGLSTALILLLVWGFMNSFFNFGLGFRMVYSLIGALLFAGYILYDTSLLIHRYGPDDYIVAAVSLYLDILNLFLFLLEILRMLQGGNN